MRVVAESFLIISLLLFSCTGGGPLTPADSFNNVKSAVEKNDTETIANCLTEASLLKINRLNLLIREMRSDQIKMLSEKFGYTEEKLRNLKTSDSIALYFFSDTTGVKLSRYFKENVVSIDIQGGNASVKTESGVELTFKREGPYWKFDLSDL